MGSCPLVIPSGLQQPLRAALPPQERLLTPCSSLLAPQPSSKGADRQQEADCGKEPGDSLPGKGGAALHPWRQPLEECSSTEHRMANSSQREGNAPKELQT